MAFSQSDIDALDVAIKSLVLTVRFQDREVTYRSMRDLLAARNIVQQEVDAGNGQMPVRQIRVFGNKGWGNG